MTLKDNVAIITGAASGIGKATSLVFAREGAKVLCADINAEGAEATARQIADTGGEAASFEVDVAEEPQVKAMIADAVSRWGRLDTIYNNAGIGTGGPVTQMSVEEWDRMHSINLRGVFLGTKHAIPEMRNAGGGSIINISSIAGLVGSALAAAYGASKGAVRLFTKATAIQYARDGIRANSVHPGIVETLMTAGSLLPDEASRQTHIARAPLGRLGQPVDVAYGVLYLASDESSFVTGSELVIDGGLTAQ